MQGGSVAHPSDADLVVRARNGDRAGFAAIYDRYGDRLHDFCWSMLRDRDEAADAVQDTFVRAVERLEQLKEPAKLRAWLYSIARREALARMRVRQRQVPDDAVPEQPDPTAGPDVAVQRSELQSLVWDAAAGLGERDRVLLDLHVRQGLDGAEFAEAAGVRPGHAYVLLNRLRNQVERSLGALLVARLGRDDCDELNTILGDWDGRFSALVRKRVARHVDDCDVCGERRRTAASPMALLSAVPIMVAPPELREIVLAAFDTRVGESDTGDGDGGAALGGGSTRLVGRLRRRPRVAALLAGVSALVIGGAGVGILLFGPDGGDDVPAVAMTGAPTATTPGAGVTPDDETSANPPSGTVEPLTPGGTPEPTTLDEAEDPSEADPVEPDSPDQPDEPDEPAPPDAPDDPDDPGPAAPGELAVSTTTLDLGAEATAGTIELSNAGGSALTYEVTSSASWLTLDHAGGELEAGSARALTVTAVRDGLAEGDHAAFVEVASPAGDATVEVTAAVERAPSIGQLAASPEELLTRGCQPSTASVSAMVTDESDIAAVELRWAGPDGSGSFPMTFRSGSWYERLGQFDRAGDVTWHVVATDARGNVGESDRLIVPVQTCVF